MAQVDPLSFVWPVTVKQFLLWHGIDEPLVDLMVAQQQMEAMSLSRAVSGSVQEDRRTSASVAALKEAKDSKLMEMVQGRDSKWPLLKEFCRQHAKQVLSPFAARP